MRRRQFIRTSTAGLVGLAAAPLAGSALFQALDGGSPPEAVWVEGGEPKELLAAALAAYGGMGSFIRPGDKVLVKPNIGFDRAPEQAATTNPELVAEVVREALAAGAKEVKVLDRTCNNPRRCYDNSQIKRMAQAAGARVEHIRPNRFTEIDLPQGEVLHKWLVYRDYLAADKVINIPIAKQHNMSRATLGLKNLMGVLGGDRGSLHKGFSRKLIDIVAHILPTVTIIDAYRILTANGPTGGNLRDVRQPRTLIMSTCTVSADWVAAELFDLRPTDIGYLREAHRRGLNKFDPTKLDLKKIVLS